MENNWFPSGDAILNFNIYSLLLKKFINLINNHHHYLMLLILGYLILIHSEYGAPLRSTIIASANSSSVSLFGYYFNKSYIP